MNRFVVFLFVIAGMTALGEAHRFALYPYKWQQGIPYEGDTDRGCQRASMLVGSVNTGGGCIMLCSLANCQGRCLRVTVGEGGDCGDHGNMHTCNLRKNRKKRSIIMWSVKGC